MAKHPTLDNMRPKHVQCPKGAAVFMQPTGGGPPCNLQHYTLSQSPNHLANRPDMTLFGFYHLIRYKMSVIAMTFFVNLRQPKLTVHLSRGAFEQEYTTK